MNARRRVGVTQATLLIGVGASAAIWTAAVAGLSIALVAGVDWNFGLTGEVRRWLRLFALALGAGAAALMLWRGRGAGSRSKVALWIEDQAPALRYALVTLLEERLAYAAPWLEREVASVSWRTQVVRALARATLVPAIVLAGASVALRTLPPGLVRRVAMPRPGDVLERPGRGVTRGGVLSPLVATVEPPAYTREARRVLEDPTEIAAIVGSGITVEGRGDAGRVRARVAAGTLTLGVPGRAGGGPGERWRVAFTMPREPAALVLSDGAGEKVLVLAPRPDSVPAVTFLAPARDTILRSPEGALVVTADARDDFGLDAIWFEVIVSAGEGESFTFRSGVVRRAAANGARSSSLGAALRLDSLGLAPGNIVHLRAVATDQNTVTGPGRGFSETRTLRIARIGEYDSISVEGAPPLYADTSLLSQRMLLMLAEALERRRPRLERPRFVDESRRIADDQARLRRRVGDVIFMRLGGTPRGEEGEGEGERRGVLSPDELLQAAESVTAMSMGEALDFAGGESPVVAVNRPLLEAYNAMWDAGRELEVAEPGRAIPHMRAALEAIQRARNAERVYLRGRAAAIVVDIARVRLAGDRAGAAASRRAPRPALADARARLAARFAAALALLERRDDGAIDSLLLLRVDALGGAPGAAAALGDAIAALRAGRDATQPLMRARRALEGGPSRSEPLAKWEGAW